MELKVVEVLILLLFSIFTDIREYKIRNYITIPFACVGIIHNSIINGLEGFLFSLSGWLVPVILLFIFFSLRMLGAGDIKLFGAIGAIMGYKFALYSIIYSFLIGGIIGVFLLLVRGNTISRFKHFFTYMKSCFLTLKLLDYEDFGNKERKGLFRFSYAVLPGTLIQLFVIFNLK